MKEKIWPIILIATGSILAIFGFVTALASWFVATLSSNPDDKWLEFLSALFYPWGLFLVIAVVFVWRGLYLLKRQKHKINLEKKDQLYTSRKNSTKKTLLSILKNILIIVIALIAPPLWYLTFDTSQASAALGWYPLSSMLGWGLNWIEKGPEYFPSQLLLLTYNIGIVAIIYMPLEKLFSSFWKRHKRNN